MQRLAVAKRKQPERSSSSTLVAVTRRRRVRSQMQSGKKFEVYTGKLKVRYILIRVNKKSTGTSKYALKTPLDRSVDCQHRSHRQPEHAAALKK